jgi:hypothetical protein
MSVSRLCLGTATFGRSVEHAAYDVVLDPGDGPPAGLGRQVGQVPQHLAEVMRPVVQNVRGFCTRPDYGNVAGGPQGVTRAMWIAP